MLLFGTGFLCGMALVVLFYHLHILAQLRKYAVDWRARAISAEQEVENWKLLSKSKGQADPFRK